MEDYLTQDLTGRLIKAESDYFAHGGFGEIWKATWPKSDSDIVEVAVKVPRIALTDTEDLAKCTKRLLRKTRAWSTLNHPNIAPIWGISFDFHRAPTPCFVLPYYRHGDIMTYLKEQPSVDRIQLITQVSMALSYLHSISLIHGNLKPTNILINDNLEASLDGFSLSRIVEAPGNMPKTISGISRWQPELLSPYEGEEEDSIPRVNTAESWRWKAYELVAPCVKEGFIPRVTAATDVWAFAMTVIEILTSHVPFSHIKSDTSVILAIASGRHPKRDKYPYINDEIWAMLESCWDIDPSRRPSMAILARFFASQSTSLSAQHARL